MSSKSHFKHNLYLYRTLITTLNLLCLVAITPDYLANDEKMGLLS
jgi:hypothetical protein